MNKPLPATYKGIPVTPAAVIREKKIVYKVDGVRFETYQQACWHIDEHYEQLKHLVIPSTPIQDS